MNRLLLTISCFAVLSGPLFAQTITWNSPVTVAMGSMYSNVYPRLTLTAGNNPLVVWENSANNNIYTSRMNGGSFTNPLTINPIGVTPFIATWAGAEIASSGDTAFVVFSTELTTSAQVYSVRSLNGGISFQDTVRVDQIGTDIPRFPAIGIGLNGNPIVNFMRLDSGFGNAEYAVARSMNGGMSYMPSITPSLGAVGTVCDCCPASITTDGDQHILMYRNNDNNIREMWASYSTDGSASYNASAEIDQTNWMLMSCPSSGPSGIIIGDSLISTWMSNGDIYISSANINDQQMGVHRQLFPMGMGTQNFPIIAGKGDTLAVVWQGTNSGSYDLFFTSSTTGTAGLGVTIDTLTNGTPGNQTRPDLEFANGKFHIVYSDDMGDDVKYLSGSVEESVGLPDNLKSSVSVFVLQENDLYSIHVQSPITQEGSIMIINATGQILMKNKKLLQEGKTVIAVPDSISTGLCFVVLTTDSGEIIKQKIILN